jgi:hypothetical protein
MIVEDKEQRIWSEISRRAREQIKFGMMNIELKVQDGKVVLAEVLQERIKIG